MGPRNRPGKRPAHGPLALQTSRLCRSPPHQLNAPVSDPGRATCTPAPACGLPGTAPAAPPCPCRPRGPARARPPPDAAPQPRSPGRPRPGPGQRRRGRPAAGARRRTWCTSHGTAPPADAPPQPTRSPLTPCLVPHFPLRTPPPRPAPAPWIGPPSRAPLQAPPLRACCLGMTSGPRPGPWCPSRARPAAWNGVKMRAGVEWVCRCAS